MGQIFWARTDSGSANNPALNLTGDPAVEITFVASGETGDLFLEYNGGLPDPDTQVEIGGTLYDFSFELSAYLPTQKRDGAQQVPDQFEGQSGYIVTVQDYPAPGDSTRLFFTTDGTASQVDMDSFGTGAIDLQGVDTTTTGAVCFGEGTLIDTPRGAVRVEDLRPGDLVETLDHGAQEILWVRRDERWLEESPETEKPILIRAGALGAGMPVRDLILSPQHRVLVGEAGQLGQALPGSGPVLVAAKALCALPGVRVMKGRKKVTWVHFAFRGHEIVRSEGALTESLLLGAMALESMSASERAMVTALFGEGDGETPLNGPAARPILGVKAFQRLYRGQSRPLRAPKMAA